MSAAEESEEETGLVPKKKNPYLRIIQHQFKREYIRAVASGVFFFLLGIAEVATSSYILFAPGANQYGDVRGTYWFAFAIGLLFLVVALGILIEYHVWKSGTRRKLAVARRSVNA